MKKRYQHQLSLKYIASECLFWTMSWRSFGFVDFNLRKKTGKKPRTFLLISAFIWSMYGYLSNRAKRTSACWRVSQFVSPWGATVSGNDTGIAIRREASWCVISCNIWDFLVYLSNSLSVSFACRMNSNSWHVDVARPPKNCRSTQVFQGWTFPVVFHVVCAMQ